jgi:hypothetical protein
VGTFRNSVGPRFGLAFVTLLAVLDGTAGKSNAAETSKTNTPSAKGDSSLPYTVDLKPFFEDVFRDPAGSDSSYLGYAGRKTIDGLPFNIDGNIPLFGKSANDRGNHYSDDVPGIKIDRKFDELHLIHAARWREYYGCPIAIVRLHYANGTTHDFPIRDKFQVDDWSRLGTENDEIVADPDTKIIWRGPGSAKGTGRLFKSVLHNPFPGLKVDTMELISTHSGECYVLVAATVAQSDPRREVTAPLPLLVSDPRFDGTLHIHVVDQTTGKPLSGAEINIAWVTNGISLVADSIITSTDGIGVVKFPKASSTDLRVQVVKDGYLTCNDNWLHGWDGPNVPDKITYPLTPGQDPEGAATASVVNPGELRNQIPDEGRLYHAMVYEQTRSGPATLVTSPYQFIAEIRNTFPEGKGTVSLPAGATWPTNPVTLSHPAGPFGAHYLYVQGFASMADLLANFPGGNYTFNLGRTYVGGFTTSYTVPVTFSDSVKIPSSAPAITNPTWKSGALVLQPAAAVIHYANKPNLKFAWDLVGRNLATGSSEGSSTGTLDLTGYLQPGQTYQAQLRFINPDSSVTVADSDAPAGENDCAYTYSTLAATIVNLTITTPPGPTSAHR